ncbi:hypothetical protein NE237_031271 [Protea cynaroides]|uniref:Uncharacterized protein n=1 Tax=Protea cynaroides TaxID=273540 RepID=A0A9Q0L173_9MAGN|nr:hypothetical protein NE237_031271 [Protea cynaroides]
MPSRPTTMSEAVGLVRLHESKLTEAKHSWNRPVSNRFTPTTTSPMPPLIAAPPTANRLPIKRLTPAQMQALREKGLCYNCDERFSPGHRCRSRQLFLLQYVDDEADIEPESSFAIEPPADPPPLDSIAQPKIPITSEISYHALAGHHSPTTLRFSASIHGSPVQVLVDS